MQDIQGHMKYENILGVITQLDEQGIRHGSF
jgi:hypothetical protein